jgi:hypothetical protein
MNAKYNPGSVFQGIIVNKKKTRKIKDENFPKLPHVQQLIKISRRKEMMQKLSLQEKKRSIDYQKKIYIVSNPECCVQKRLIITWITCRNKMK